MGTTTIVGPELCVTQSGVNICLSLFLIRYRIIPVEKIQYERVVFKVRNVISLNRRCFQPPWTDVLSHWLHLQIPILGYHPRSLQNCICMINSNPLFSHHFPLKMDLRNPTSFHFCSCKCRLAQEILHLLSQAPFLGYPEHLPPW